MTSPTELVSSPGLNLSFAETGPIPNNQCALKDALLLAISAGTSDADEIVANATTFLAFLDGAGTNQPTTFAPAPGAALAAPAAGDPVPAGVTPGVNDTTPAPTLDAPADGGDGGATVNGFPAGDQA